MAQPTQPQPSIEPDRTVAPPARSARTSFTRTDRVALAIFFASTIAFVVSGAVSRGDPDAGGALSGEEADRLAFRWGALALAIAVAGLATHMSWLGRKIFTAAAQAQQEE